MNHLFKRLPLPVKLMLIGLVPLVFLIFLSARLYTEKTQKLKLLSSYIDRMNYSSDITQLIDNLQTERKYSYEFVLKKTQRNELLRQRPQTDSIIKRLSHYDEPLADLASYTFLDNLTNVRIAIDSGRMQPTIVMDAYTNMIFRLNTINTLPTGSSVYLQPAYKDLVAQKLISEMITYMGIMCANIYNALYTRQYMVEIVWGTRGVYQINKTYETEFKLKASPDALRSYKSLEEKTSVGLTKQYLDKIFTTFKFDSTYDYVAWGKISSAGIDGLRQFQQELLHNAEAKIDAIYKKEQRSKKSSLVFLLLSLAFVTGLALYSIRIITIMLNELKNKAQQISLGAPGPALPIISNDAIGSLALSIDAIDKNNKQLANAAYAIGRGHFDVPVEPRSPDDILGNAIVTMKQNLQKSITELATSNAELEKFAYVASHDLQEPLRMVRSFMDLLQKKLEGTLDESSQQYIHFAIDGAERMKTLVRDLLQYSRIGTNKNDFTAVDCNEVMNTVKKIFELTIFKTNAVLDIKPLLVIRGLKVQVEQLFQNLIGNALKYSGDKTPHIEIGYTETENSWQFYVKDNGIGIEPRFFEKIFVIFQRLHGRSEYSGTGIGLAICKKIVERHGGEIWLESEVGVGTTFFFTIKKSVSQ